jgi:PAS domain S-box-containing protein
MSGLDVLSAIREHHQHSQLPVIMVTARASGADVVEALRLGANDYVTKPIDFAVTVARIETHLGFKRAVADLRESEERYALAVQGANDGLWDWNLVSGQVYWSPRWKSILGLEAEEIGTSADEWLLRVHPDDINDVRAALTAYLADATGHFYSEHRVRHRDETYRWVRCRGAAVRTDAGVASRLAGSLTDITDVKLADALTGLPNRLLFIDLVEARHQAQRAPCRIRVRDSGALARSIPDRARQPRAARRRSPARGGGPPPPVEPARHRRRHSRRAGLHAGAAGRRRVHGAD